MTVRLKDFTLADVEAVLADPRCTVYLYVGKEDDAGWRHALVAHDIFTQLDVFLIHETEMVSEWEADLEEGDRCGIVFGFGPSVKKILSASEARDRDKVLAAILEHSL